MDWVKSNWVVIVAIASMGTAWGTQQNQVQDLQKKVDAAGADNAAMKDQAARIDERTKFILDSQHRQEEDLKQILKQLRTK